MPKGMKGFQKGELNFVRMYGHPTKGKKGFRGANSGSFKKGQTPWIKGKRLGFIPVGAFKKGQISWNKGKHLSSKHIENLRISHLGHKTSDITKQKLREINKIKIKEGKHNFWRGGISFEPYSIDWTKTLKRSIRERDKYTCQICGKEPSTHCHHIDYDKKNCNPDNLIVLCNSCHAKTNFNREYWKEYFKNIIYG